MKHLALDERQAISLDYPRLSRFEESVSHGRDYLAATNTAARYFIGRVKREDVSIKGSGV